MDKLTLAAIILAVAIVSVGATILLYDDTESYKISYELDGGTLDEQVPTKYTPGQYLKIASPDKDDCIFNGWYLDSTYTNPFDGYTIDMTGDITLYASWSDNLSGHTVTLTKSGYFDRGFNSYTISGDLTFTYLYYNPDKESYFIENADNTTYTYKYIGRSYSESTTNTYWNDDIDGDWVDLGEDTISVVIDGVEVQKECDVLRLVYSNTSTEKRWETQWIGDGWIPYKIVYYYSVSTWIEKYELQIEYTYKSDGYVEIPSNCNIDVIEGHGITVTGNDSPYKLGETATLTANVSDDVTFSGWYDENFVLLSTDKTYKFIVGGNVTIYAMNSNSEEDKVFESDTLVNLNIDGELINATYTITNADSLESFTSSSDTFTFDDAGMYRIVGVGENKSIFYIAKVTGDVTRTFEWKYDKHTYTIELDIDYDDLQYARDLYPASKRCQDSSHVRDKTFVTWSYTDEVMAPYMAELVEKLCTEFNKNYKTANEVDLLGFLLSFTQYIEYQSDEEYMGVEEYWKFPLETLYDQGGDCEDTSILFIALAHECRSVYSMNYKVALQLLPGHMAGAVKISSSIKASTNPSGYIYGETTVIGYSLGEIPDTMKDYFTSERYYKQKYCTTVEID